MGGASSEPFAVLGGGPAGLTAGYVLARSARPVVVFEADGQVGGLARTVVRDGYRFDLGGHRFFTKSDEVQTPVGAGARRRAARARPPLADLLARALHRLSAAPRRRRAQGRPRRARALLGLLRAGASPAARCAAGRARRSRTGSAIASGGACSSCSSRATPRRCGACRPPRSAPSGRRSASAPCRSRASCARRCSTTAATCAASSSSFTTRGWGPARCGRRWRPRSSAPAGSCGSGRGSPRSSSATGASTPSTPAASASRSRRSSRRWRCATSSRSPTRRRRPPCAEAAAGLRYRDFLTVALVVRGEDLFPDNWIYVHEPEVRVGRIQNFRAWSEAMVPDPARTCVGHGVLLLRGRRVVERKRRRARRAGRRASSTRSGWRRRPASRAVTSCACRRPIRSTTPTTTARVATIRAWLAGIENLQQIGRNGLHRYNNSDHSMLTALRAVENACAGAAHDLWAVNADGEYHEEARTPVQPYRDAPETPVLRAAATRSPSAGSRRSARSTRRDGRAASRRRASRGAGPATPAAR